MRHRTSKATREFVRLQDAAHRSVAHRVNTATRLIDIALLPAVMAFIAHPRCTPAHADNLMTTVAVLAEARSDRALNAPMPDMERGWMHMIVARAARMECKKGSSLFTLQQCQRWKVAA